MAAGLWWFFALIIISSYTANMAAFLTFVHKDEHIQSIDDLAIQNKIKYGLIRGGSTESFFKYSDKPIYQRMWNVMEREVPSVFVNSNSEGMERVLQSHKTYAFFMESTSIEYVMHTNCNLVRIGPTLDSKAYGIGMPKSKIIFFNLRF